MEEVGQWLDSLGLAEYQEHFRSHEIQGQELLTLGRQDLKVRQMGGDIMTICKVSAREAD